MNKLTSQHDPVDGGFYNEPCARRRQTRSTTITKAVKDRFLGLRETRNLCHSVETPQILPVLRCSLKYPFIEKTFILCKHRNFAVNTALGILAPDLLDNLAAELHLGPLLVGSQLSVSHASGSA